MGMFRTEAQRFKNQFGAMVKVSKTVREETSCFCSPPPTSAAGPLSQESRPSVVCQIYREAGGRMWLPLKSAHSTAEAPAVAQTKHPLKRPAFNVLNKPRVCVRGSCVHSKYKAKEQPRKTRSRQSRRRISASGTHPTGCQETGGRACALPRAAQVPYLTLL